MAVPRGLRPSWRGLGGQNSWSEGAEAEGLDTKPGQDRPGPWGLKLAGLRVLSLS